MQANQINPKQKSMQAIVGRWWAARGRVLRRERDSARGNIFLKYLYIDVSYACMGAMHFDRRSYVRTHIWACTR